MVVHEDSIDGTNTNN